MLMFSCVPGVSSPRRVIPRYEGSGLRGQSGRSERVRLEPRFLAAPRNDNLENDGEENDEEADHVAVLVRPRRVIPPACHPPGVSSRGTRDLGCAASPAGPSMCGWNPDSSLRSE